jgi:hypothetical protein
MSARVIDLCAWRALRARKRLLRTCPRVWVSGRWLYVLSFFSGDAA